jgi:branched-chain amino acid transport system substrate-binding protein
MVNERDGGIGGVPVRVLECETGYNTEKSVECYESTKAEGSLVYQPMSTGVTYQLIPKATADGIALHTLGYGRTSAANGRVFSNVFNYPANYWTAASVAVNHLLTENGGSISGKKVTLVYHNSAYGKEPIRVLEMLADKHGFDFNAIPVDHPGQEQKSQWLQIRREKPDYVLMWGWGVMNSVAINEAANIRFPMENFIGVWWSGSENDVVPAGMRADGYKALAMNAPGTDYGIYDELKANVWDKGLTAGAGDQIGSVLYNRALYMAFLTHMAIEKAQEVTGVADISQADMIKGMEALEITDAMMAENGLKGFAPSFKVTCEDHGGSGLGAVQQWDATAKTWNLITDFIEPDMGMIAPLIKEDSEAFAKENNIAMRC